MTLIDRVLCIWRFTSRIFPTSQPSNWYRHKADNNPFIRSIYLRNELILFFCSVIWLKGILVLIFPTCSFITRGECTFSWWTLQPIYEHCSMIRTHQFGLCVCFYFPTPVTYGWGLIWAVRMKNQLRTLFSYSTMWTSKIIFSGLFIRWNVCVSAGRCMEYIPSWTLFGVVILKNVCAAVSSNSKFNADYICVVFAGSTRGRST